MYRWLWAKFYDNIMRNAEDKGLREWRHSLLKNASGDILELGCGNGANLEFYSNTSNRLVLIEPNKHMHQKLNEKIKKYKLNHAEIIKNNAENLSFMDGSFDTVVCTLVLCSVKDLKKALSEIFCLLRPQGKLIFIEHTVALNNPERYQWQQRLEFLWKHIADGCHVTRHTEEAIMNAGFQILEIKHQSMRGVPAIVRPSIRGVAIRP